MTSGRETYCCTLIRCFLTIFFCSLADRRAAELAIGDESEQAKAERAAAKKAEKAAKKKKTMVKKKTSEKKGKIESSLELMSEFF